MTGIPNRCRRASTDPLALTVALVAGAIAAAASRNAPFAVWGCLAGAAGHALSGSV